MEALYKYNRPSHDKLKVLEKSTAVLAKAILNDLYILKTGINGHEENLDILNKTIWDIINMIDQKLQKRIMTLNNYHLVVKMLSKAFTAYTNVVRK